MPKIDNPIDSLMEEFETHVPLENAPVGIHLGISFERYCAIQAINHSRLNRARDSLLHYKNIPAKDESPSLAFGSFAHTGRLEPEEIEKKYVVIPNSLSENILTKSGEPATSPRATSEYKNRVKEFLSLHPGKLEVSEDWLNKIKQIVKNIDAHPRAGKFFKQGIPEVTIIWEDKKTGLKCKGRIDWLAGPTPDMSIPELIKATKAIVDLKTTEDIFKFELDKWNYHSQAAFYLEGWKTLTKKITPFEFTVVENSSPNAVRSAPVGGVSVAIGKEEIAFLLGRIAEAEESGIWPGPTDPSTWEVSHWYKEKQFTQHHPLQEK